MPSFQARFSVNGFHALLNYVYLDINQAVDTLGRPASLTRGGKITVEFNSTDDAVVAEWMVNPAKRLNGTVHFMRIDSVETTEKEIEFVNAYCVDLHERFDATVNESHMVTTVTISPEKIIVGGIILNNRWPDTA